MSNRSTEKSKWQRVRKFFNDIHLWLGLTSGLVVIAVCLSGTIYVFNTELTERAAPHLYKVKPPERQQRIPVDSLLEKIRTNTGGKIVSITIPADLTQTYQFNIRTKADSTNRGGTTYMVNPIQEILQVHLKIKMAQKNLWLQCSACIVGYCLTELKTQLLKEKPTGNLGA